jgi:hypothetical protein
VADLGAGLGVGRADGRWSVLARSVARLVQFGVARWDGERLEVRRALPPVSSQALQRLGATAQRVHAAELARAARQGPEGNVSGADVAPRAGRRLRTDGQATPSIGSSLPGEGRGVDA